MFDTSVLSYLVSAEPDRDTLDYEEWMAAKMMAATIDEVMISAIVLYELHDVILPSGKSLAEAVAKVVKFDVRPIDGAVMDKAGEILRKARQEFEACARCRAWQGEVECKKCKRLVPKQYKKNDAIVVAHAHCISDIGALYAFDKPMRSLKQYVRDDLAILAPPHPAAPLFGSEKPAAE